MKQHETALHFYSKGIFSTALLFVRVLFEISDGLFSLKVYVLFYKKNDFVPFKPFYFCPFGNPDREIFSGLPFNCLNVICKNSLTLSTISAVLVSKHFARSGHYCLCFCTSLRFMLGLSAFFAVLEFFT